MIGLIWRISGIALVTGSGFRLISLNLGCDFLFDKEFVQIFQIEVMLFVVV